MPTINKGRKSAFTLVEILVVIAILAILAVVTFVIINPVERINSANDTTAKEDVKSIVDAVAFYVLDTGSAPTYNNGGASTALPTVTATSVMVSGVNVTLLQGISPNYLTTIPDKGYRIGRLASGAIIVGATLSDGSVHTLSQ